MIHTCKPSVWSLRQGCTELEASLGYILTTLDHMVRPHHFPSPANVLGESGVTFWKDPWSST